MHEMALMGDVLQLISDDARIHGFEQITEVELIVGDLSNALPDALEMAFLIYRKQGAARLSEDATLTIRREQACAKCCFCGLEYEPKQRIALCPGCQMPGGKLQSGETFKVHAYHGE